LGQALSDYPPVQCRCHSRARASLRTRHQGPCMGLFLSRSLRTAAHLFSFISFVAVSSSRPGLGSCVALTLRLRARRHACCDRDGDQRGARLRGAINRATTLYPVGPRTQTMMQSCASAAKLRSGGPILPIGTKAKGHAGIPPPRTVIGVPSQADGGQGRNCQGAFNVLRSLCCRTQNDSVRHNALPREPPQGDQKLACQGHDHGLASAAGVLGAGSKPLHQGAVLLVQKEPPR